MILSKSKVKSNAGYLKKDCLILCPHKRRFDSSAKVQWVEREGQVSYSQVKVI